MSVPRPLPARPSLEYERKEAKALLRRLRAADPRARLADAQLAIAREYGFASWPRLVRYFTDAERERGPGHDVRPRDHYESFVRSLLVEHAQRRQLAARTLAAYVPRLYRRPASEVFAATVTEEEARLATARRHGFPSWDVLIEQASRPPRRRPDWEREPIEHAGQAIAAADLPALQRVVEAHPELLHPSDADVAMGRSLLRSALAHEMRGAPVRHIVEWLATQGFDVRRDLNAQLCGSMYMQPEHVRRLLDRGADPDAVMPNGSTVLEHALILYWNGAAVDVLVGRARPREALWIAAGLGDVPAVRRFLDPAGKPTAAARRVAPPVGLKRSLPTHPDPGDEELLLEAFFVAMLNGRTAVTEYLASRGLDVNTRLWDSPVLNIAAGNAWPPVVACLLRCGADPDLKGYHPTQSAREIARWRLVNNDRDPGVREVAALLGIDADAVLAEHDARRAPPTIDPALQDALALAADDARRLGQTDVRPDNLLFGLLRAGGIALAFFTRASRMDVERFHADVAERVRPATERLDGPALPLHADAQALVDAAVATAVARRREQVQGLHLLHALTRAERSTAAELLARYGSSAEKLREELEKGM
ncbi:Clp domain protein (plasmid) [Gemmatirosa kalamazoonensis]|uniref:Clp domain protein n=1 Tax=Gemmatirosa kalamazoonensis TaxID=861299 RepID=W0RQK7_9BACT|nr:Clp protease N-terminal domain-containing protein [Gemmatirosa kalamazoonensis]AHG92737.1 Clp domain protein [Gemmatirosa kalamazoonensis]